MNSCAEELSRYKLKTEEFAMPKNRKTLGDRMLLLGMERCVVGTFDSIALVDFRGHGESFRRSIERSLRLVQNHDSRRYARITKHIYWIANQVTNTMGIEYNSRIRVCSIEFSTIPDVSQDILAAGHACLLVHEATHAVIEAHGIEYDTRNRVRIECLCMTEQNRFAARLAAADPEKYPINKLHMDFDENYWKREWTANRPRRMLSFLSRWFSDRKDNQHSK